MSATQRHPAHDLFDHWWVPGGIQTLVLREHAREPVAEPDPAGLVTFFRDQQCHDAVRLIEYIASQSSDGSRLSQIGSGSVDVGALIGLTREQDPWALQELYIGSHRHNISPLQWFAYLARAFDEIPKPLRPVFDKFCGALVTMVNLPSTPMSFDELDELPALNTPRRRTLADMFGDLDAEALENPKKTN
jgi:hypothetical protein